MPLVGVLFLFGNMTLQLSLVLITLLSALILDKFNKELVFVSAIAIIFSCSAAIFRFTLLIYK